METEIPEMPAEAVHFDEKFWHAFSRPINGTDARRRLEDKLEDQRLRKALMEYDFDF
ncbi:PA3496 family putative envelope integrity protein [Agaribacterium haliotis]|uniref:PA3496 family putative envelope integrity protein n=1 Tax=Agaribacterium haliotis TaxID=2013869 RepID=UPI001304754B|nr:hypothetical protein [Agaribacterium haliotis]